MIEMIEIKKFVQKERIASSSYRLRVPKNSKLHHLGMQEGKLCFWFDVDPKMKEEVNFDYQIVPAREDTHKFSIFLRSIILYDEIGDHFIYNVYRH